MVGLALPYILWGVLADVSGTLRVSRAHATAAILTRRSWVVVLQVEVLGPEGRGARLRP